MLRIATLGLALVACGARGAEPVPRSQAPDGFWDHWGDGRAEIDRYDLVQPRYGELRDGVAVLVFVTEDLSRDTRVKFEGHGHDPFPVLKLNEIRDFTTGIYDYNTMRSVFVPLDGSAPLGTPAKVSLSVQEWCGHVYEQWITEPGEARVERHSYFEGEGDQRRVVKLPPGVVFADAWPVLVRGLAGEVLGPGETVRRPWLTDTLAARFQHQPARVVQAEIARSADTEPVDVPAGRFDAWKVTVRADGDVRTAWVERDPPHRIVRWEVSTGERAELAASIREAYWTMNHNADLPARDRLGLPR